MKIQNFIRNKVFLVLCLILILVDLLYPVTFTYDSGQYFSYFNILSGKLSWENWDPVRGPIFPVYLKTITDLLGNSLNSLLIPAVLFHLLLFTIASYLVLSAINNSYSLSNRAQRILLILVFALIVIDPLIIGFFHAALTEYIASTIAMVSCVISYFLYNVADQKGKFFPFYFIIFSILIILAWHLKQPYFGAALFPLLLVSIIIIIKQKKKTVSFHIILGNILVIIMLIVSVFIWDLILPNTGLASNPGRNTSAFIDRIYVQNLDSIKSSPIVFLKNFIKNYLALSNLFYYDQENYQIDKTFSITRASENRTIGYRIYVYGETNMAIPTVYPESYMEYIKYYSTNYYPPKYLNQILQLTTIKSTVLFSSLYLILPFILLPITILLVLSKNENNWMLIVFLCSGSAFLNAIEHALLNNPIDRYLFWGYPLLLISLLIIVIYLFNNIYSKINMKRQNSSKDIIR